MPFVEKELDALTNCAIEAREDLIVFSTIDASGLGSDMFEKLKVSPNDSEIQASIVNVAAEIAKDAGYKVELDGSPSASYVKIFIPKVKTTAKAKRKA